MKSTSISVDGETHTWLIGEARRSGLSIRKVLTTLIRHASDAGWHVTAGVIQTPPEPE